jgi:hypothetical protein
VPIAAQVPSAPAGSAPASERLAADTPKTNALGNAFVAPKDWSIRVKGSATVLEAPEGDSWIALVDVQAKGPEEALATAWQAYKPDAKWQVKVTNDLADRDGWSRPRFYEYLTSPNEKRGVDALVHYSGSNWTVGLPGKRSHREVSSFGQAGERLSFDGAERREHEAMRRDILKNYS